jgi:hypothetical protein
VSAPPEPGEVRGAGGPEEFEFARLRDLLEEALDADEAARARLLAEVAAADPRLGAELAELVRADQAPSPLDRGFDGVALALAETVASAGVQEAEELAATPWPAPQRIVFAVAALGLVVLAGLAITRSLADGPRDGAAEARPESEDRTPSSTALREAALRAAGEGAPERGLAALAEAVDLDEAAFRSAPESRSARLRYAESLLWLAAQRTAAGRAGAALEPLARAESLLGEADVADEELLRVRARVAIESSLAELELGHLPRALEHQQRAVALQRSSALPAEDLERVLALRDLGDLHRQLGQRPDAAPVDRTAHRRAAHEAYSEALLAARGAEVGVRREGEPVEIVAARRSLTERLAAMARELDGAGT